MNDSTYRRWMFRLWRCVRRKQRLELAPDEVLDLVQLLGWQRAQMYRQRYDLEKAMEEVMHNGRNTERK